MARVRVRIAAVLAVASAAVAISAASARGGAAAEPVTFSKDVAPILFEHCGGCHHPDGPAPFSLLSYAEAKRRASLIAAATRTHVMPPWKSEPGYGDFVGHTHLTESQIDLLARWVSDGAPEGDPSIVPATPTWVSGWQLGTPDLIVTWPEAYTVKADGQDFSRTFVLSLPVASVRYVRGFEFHPGNGRVVHHANIRIDRTSGSRRLDEADPAPGYSGLLLPSAVYPDGHFLGWTPGQTAPLLPPGLAWRLHPGTDLVVEMHFVPDGKLQVVQPSVGLFFGTDAPDRTPAMLRLGRQNIDIPAGETAYVTTDSFVLPVDVEVEAVQPHAHYRAREVRGTARLPDGTETPLIYIKDWDYRWQHVYRYVKPPSFPKGTTLSMRYVFDNSAENVRNPHQPPRRVTWGQQSTDEMGDLWIQMLTRSERDLEILNAAIQPKETAEEIVGYEMMIRADPTKVSLHNDVAVMYDETGRPDRAAEHFEAVVKLQPESAEARYNLGTALLASGKTAESIAQYEQAIRLRPAYAAAHNNWGRALVQLAKPAEALAHFRDAVRIDPASAEPHFNIGLLAGATGNTSDAIREFREAIRLDPDDADALGSLAWLLATSASDAVRAPAEALRFAERASAIAGLRNARALDILAAAQAANGLFDVAVATCDAALALNPSPALAAAIRQRKELYQRGRAFVQ
jgi:tetratricopeptide (TPR) repeat protein/mono/diheme cytochrome c family protein